MPKEDTGPPVAATLNTPLVERSKCDLYKRSFTLTPVKAAVDTPERVVAAVTSCLCDAVRGTSWAVSTRAALRAFAPNCSLRELRSDNTPHYHLTLLLPNLPADLLLGTFLDLLRGKGLIPCRVNEDVSAKHSLDLASHASHLVYSVSRGWVGLDNLTASLRYTRKVSKGSRVLTLPDVPAITLTPAHAVACVIGKPGARIPASRLGLYHLTYRPKSDTFVATARTGSDGKRTSRETREKLMGLCNEAGYTVENSPTLFAFFSVQKKSVRVISLAAEVTAYEVKHRVSLSEVSLKDVICNVLGAQAYRELDKARYAQLLAELRRRLGLGSRASKVEILAAYSRTVTPPKARRGRQWFAGKALDDCLCPEEKVRMPSLSQRLRGGKSLDDCLCPDPLIPASRACASPVAHTLRLPRTALRRRRLKFDACIVIGDCPAQRPTMRAKPPWEARRWPQTPLPIASAVRYPENSC